MSAGNATLLRLITRLNVGGPARQALLLTRSLSAEFPTLLAAGRPSASEGELHSPEVAVHHVPLVRPIDPRTDLAAVLAVRKLIVSRRVRLLHTHMAKAGGVGRIAARSVSDRPRTVHTFHGHVLDGYFTPRVQRAFIESERLLARNTDVLIAISPEIRDSLVELRIGRRAQYEVVPLGLDLDDFLAVDGPSGSLRKELALAPDQCLVGVIGRLVPIKDHATLLAAIEQLPDVHLAVIGDGELRHQLEAHSRASGLEHRVHFTGWRTDMPSTLSDLDIVALSSRNEGTPVALIEALAARRAVVATAVGGVGAVVNHDVTGLLVPPASPEALAAAIRRLQASPALRQRLGDRGREHVATRFGSARLVGEMAALYRQVLDSKP